MASVPLKHRDLRPTVDIMEVVSLAKNTTAIKRLKYLLQSLHHAKYLYTPKTSTCMQVYLMYFKAVLCPYQEDEVNSSFSMFDNFA